VRIEADDARSVRYEIRKGVDIVVNAAPIAIVDHGFDPADVNASRLRDLFASGNDITRRRDGFHAQLALGRLDRTSGSRGASELHAVAGLAGIRRTKIEAARCRINVDRIEEFAAERLDTCNVAIARRDVFLHKRDTVETQLDAVFVRGRL
jgi:hypothetical protein